MVLGGGHGLETPLGEVFEDFVLQISIRKDNSPSRKDDWYKLFLIKKIENRNTTNGENQHRNLKSVITDAMSKPLKTF